MFSTNLSLKENFRIYFFEPKLKALVVAIKLKVLK